MDYSREAGKQIQSTPGKQNSLIVRMVDLDISEPIDFIKPVENLSGQHQLFITMLTRLEVMSLT